MVALPAGHFLRAACCRTALCGADAECVILLLRRNRQAARLLASLSRVGLAVLGGLLLLAVSTARSVNSELLLRLYPAAVNLGMLLLSAARYTSVMIERFARLGEAELPLASYRLHAA